MQNKVVIITGASSGIGRAAAMLFARNNARVVAIGRSKKELKALSEEAASHNAKILPFIADIRKTEKIDELFDYVSENLNQIDVLINSAGIILNGTIENTTLDDWDEMMNINLRSAFYVMKKSVPFLETTKGNIVNVSSVAGTRAFPNILAYCVAKAGVDQLTRCAALELAPKEIRVNAVNPGVVVSNLHKRSGMEENKYMEFLENSKKTHPIGRVGTPLEVAELIYYLASEKAGWITGATYEIDGGRAQTCAR